VKYKKLGRTDIDVSLICLGTMTWGEQNTEAEGHEQMDYALEQGVNFFDTAELYSVPIKPATYGRTEEIIGTWFKARQNRDKVILASKVAGRGPEWIRGGGGVDRENIMAAIEGSLKRLQTDYIDLYQLHWPNRDDYNFNNHWYYRPVSVDPEREKESFLEVLQALDDLVKAGKIRHVGLSNETSWGTMQYLQIAKEHNLPRMVSVQNEYSLLDRIFEPDMVEVAMHEDVGLLAWSPLATGLLSGKYIDGARPPGSRLTLAGAHAYRDTKNANEAVKLYKKVAEKHGLTLSDMALAFVNQQPFVTANIIGATSMEQLKSNINSVTIDLNEEVIRDIQAVYKDYPVAF